MHSTSEIESTPEYAKVKHAIACSPFVSRLLTGDAAMLPEVIEKLGTAFSRDEMQVFLNAQPINDEASLKRALLKF